MKNIRSNKGAAVISVMIGILFITILASSLLYMSTMNMQMKAMRQGATDTFYTAEYALGDALSQIRQMVKVADDPGNAIETTLKQSSGNYWNETNVRNMIHIETIMDGLDSSFGTNGVEVSCIYKNGTGYTRETFVKDGAKYTLYGVHIAVKMDEEHGGYLSSITTDIELKFPGSVDKGKEINDFSVLADCPMNVSAGSHVFTGCMYCTKNGKLGSAALKVGSSGMANVIGDYNFFNGDVIVENGGILVLAGEVKINGNLEVKPGATLYVAGDVEVQGTATVGNSVRVATGGTIKDGASATKWAETSVNWDFYNNEEYENGLAKTLMTNNIYTGGKQAGVREYTPVEFIDKTGGSITGSGNEMKGTFNVDGQTGVAVKANFACQPIHASEGYKDALVLTKGNFDLHNVKSFEDCTLFNFAERDSSNPSNSPCINLDTTVKSNIWGNMTDDKYEAAKKLFITPASGNFSGWDDQSVGGFKMLYPASGSSMDDLTRTGEIGDPTTTYQINGVDVVLYAQGGVGQYYFRTDNNDSSGNTDYIPVGNFLADDTSTKIARFMSGSPDSNTPTNDLVIKLVNWQKD